mmetsp:Transcript_21927/g.46250  ORF Transcript_21927/g.46250 Transcript_21927/m.46250 type:complete len:92 (-) Transcript_21927:92-367(-)
MHARNIVFGARQNQQNKNAKHIPNRSKERRNSSIHPSVQTIQKWLLSSMLSSLTSRRFPLGALLGRRRGGVAVRNKGLQFLKERRGNLVDV